jgi:uncharacterized protein
VESPRQLRVTGEGTLSAEPDRWALVAAINAMADSAADALTKVNQLVGSATKALVDAGVDRSSLRTQNLLLHDYFDQVEQRVTARVASYELEVSTTTVDALGSVIASLGALLDNNLQIRGIRPTVADPEPLYQEAQARAVSTARAKAQALAQSSEVTLGRILSIEEQRSLGVQFQGTSNTAFRAAGGRAVIPPMPVEPGVLSVRAFVTIVYEIE